MPHELEAELVVDGNDVTINPHFRNPVASTTAMYLTVSGKNKGNERRYVLTASGRDGKLTLQEIKSEAVPLFDATGKKKPIEDPTGLGVS